MKLDEIYGGVLKKSPRAIARAISMAEDCSPSGRRLLQKLYPRTGGATVIGITGAPGAGKSTLIDCLIPLFRKRNKTVGVVAIDPTSFFTGGAILGDRIRMQKHSTDPGTYIRSMATRGEMGGLARATIDAVDILDAGGYDVILVETVGVGQDEVEVANCAQLVVLALTPEAGDDIQAIKAGIMEIADIFVINKADIPGADGLSARIRATLELDETGRRKPRILQTVAVKTKGISELFAEIQKTLKEIPPRDNKARALKQGETRLVSVLKELLLEKIFDALEQTERQKIVGGIASRKRDPYTSAEGLISRLNFSKSSSREKNLEKNRLLKRIDHIGIAVKNIKSALRFYTAGLGIKSHKTQNLKEAGARVCFIAAGETHIELLEPLADDTPVGKFISSRGEGMHHIAFEVGDINLAMKKLKNAGFVLLNEKPRKGANETLVLFIHPKTAHGTLYELVEKK